MQGLLKEFQNPSVRYRPLPFWSWNDKLDPELLKWQIQEMKKVGLGGYFMHARGGLETEYLSEEWMECVRECIGEGNRQDLESWLYDESGWPSGFAGGLVTAHGDKYHGRWLTIEDYDPVATNLQTDNILGIYLIDSDQQVTKLETLTSPHAGERVVIIRHHANRDYIDVLNAEAVRLFIEYTHQRYLELFGEEFGTGLLGFFTDEPRLSGSVERDIPWSYVLPDKFQERYGYNLLAVLPALFLPCADYIRVRYDFWQLVSNLFVTAFMKQINEWCEKHNLVLTGHAMMEESLFTQMTSTGGVMPFYEHMGMPGIDWLRRTISTPVVPKQVSSVASQLGRKFVLTESYALSGWNVSFEDLKWIAEWQYVNGVNRMCQHLQGYTIRGLRKRDYPPSLFIQQSWWDEYKIFNDYLSRLGVMLSAGTPVADVLVIHPIRSGWLAYNGQKNAELEKLDRDFIAISEMLSGLHVDYHYGDETIMQGYGVVRGDQFKIGHCSYKVVVLPSMLGVSSHTLQLLKEFVANGGLVISAGDYPTYCDGQVSEELAALKEHVIDCGLDADRLVTALNERQVARLSITEADNQVWDIHYQQRDLGESQVFFLVNHSVDQDYQVTVELPGIGGVQQMQAETGELVAMAFKHQGSNTIVELDFAPRQSYVLLFTTEQTEEYQPSTVKKQLVQLEDSFEITDMDLNSLTIDRCEYRIDGGEWQEPVAVIHLMDQLLNLRRSCDLEMKFSFMVETDPKSLSQFYLVLEDATNFEIIVNGQQLEFKDIGWWKDTSFKKVDIKDYVVAGENQIILKRHFSQSDKVYHVLFGEDVYETEKNQLTYDVELESIYLVGDFGVISKTSPSYGERSASFTAGSFVIVDQPKKLHKGDFIYQGLLFFAGKLILSQRKEIRRQQDARVFLTLKKPDAPLAKLYVNNSLVKTLLWPPYEIDITDYIVDGENTITIELFASNRNLLGPHHHINGELYSVGPESFSGKWSWVEKKSETETTTPEIRQQCYWRDDYCFVKFGIPK